MLVRFWRDYVHAYTGILLLAGVFMMVVGGSLGLVSYYVKPMFDEIFVSGDQDAITELSVIMFFIFAARGLAAFLQRSLTMYVGLNVIADLQRNLLSHLLTLDAVFYHRHAPGALIERVRGDAQTLQQVSSNALIIIGRDTFSLIALLAVALYIDWKWMAIALLSAPLIVLPVWMVQKLVRKTTYAAREASASISSRLDEIFHGFKAIKINNTETHESERFSAGIRQFVKEEYKAELGKAALPSLIDIIAGLGFVGVMIYGGQQIIAGEKTVGDFMSFFTALALVFDPLRRLTGVGGQLQAALASLERLYQLFDARAAIENPASPLPFDHTANGDIRFERVTFAYDAHKPVLQNLSFVVPQGKMTALVGPSGA